MRRREERKDVALCIVLLLNRNCVFQAAELIAPWEREEKNGFHSFALKPIQHGLKAEFPYEIPMKNRVEFFTRSEEEILLERVQRRVR